MSSGRMEERNENRTRSRTDRAGPGGGPAADRTDYGLIPSAYSSKDPYLLRQKRGKDCTLNWGFHG